jgi:peptidoglycan/xylan/chitin deacetylase (PgdA/CDA1 family)
VTIDGAGLRVSAGATVADSVAKLPLKAPSGDLLAIDGTVVRPGGGEPPRVLRNGSPAAPSQKLYDGDVLISRPGADVREAVETTDLPIPYVTAYQGKGSLLEERMPGVPGVRRVLRGTVSGVEISSTVVSMPREAVVQRYHPRKGAKIVALTFDDGPWPGSTTAILDVLKKEQVPATFFVVGARVKRQPTVARRVVAEGHQMANHTLGHRSLNSAKPKEIKRQVRSGRATIRKYTGVDTRWLRPPYGAMSASAWKFARKEKTHVVLWDVDSRDWTKPGAKKIASSVVKHTKPGAIVLMHDGGGSRAQTVKALPTIIKRLKAKGYTFVSVEELYAVRQAKR